MLITDLNKEQTQERINEIDTELAEIRNLKKANKVTLEDIEDVSDNYQYNLEWNELMHELNFERNQLVQHRNYFHSCEVDCWDGDDSQLG